MGIIKAFSDSVKGVLGDQWLETITTGGFDEHTVVLPGMVRSQVDGLGSNYYGCDGVISEGSRIFVPENTAAFIFSENGIEEVITKPGSYEYKNGVASVFSGAGLGSIVDDVGDRLKYGGVPSSEKSIAFINLKEIRNIKFGTRGPQVYYDSYYQVDLEVIAYGSFSLKIVDPIQFVRNYLPANITYYSFDDDHAADQITAEFLQSFSVALHTMSSVYRMAEIQQHLNEITTAVSADDQNVGTWGNRFGFVLTKVAIENIEYSQESRKIINQYASDKLRVSVYEDVSQKAANIAAQQRIAKGIERKGVGDAAGIFVGMNAVNSMNQTSMSIEQQIEIVNKLKAMLDAGVLTKAEFEKKKKEIMDL